MIYKTNYKGLIIYAELLNALYLTELDKRLKFYKVFAVLVLLYGSDCWTVTKQQLQQIESSEMRFLRSVAGYRKTDTKRNTDIRQNLKIFSLGQKIREYQQNYLEHILRIPTYLIRRKIFNYHPKGRRDEVDHRRDG
jgi:hypothetical protein